MTEQAPNLYGWQKKETPTLTVPSGYFQVQAHLLTGNVTGSYYNTQSKVTFDCPWDTQTFHEEKSNQRMHIDNDIPPPPEFHSHQGQTGAVNHNASTT